MKAVVTIVLALGVGRMVKVNTIIRGSILEHLLIQQLTAFYEVGEHNICRLRGADWNDALDMAPERGESVAFTCAYAGNLRELAELIRALADTAGPLVPIPPPSLEREVPNPVSLAARTGKACLRSNGFIQDFFIEFFSSFLRKLFRVIEPLDLTVLWKDHGPADKVINIHFIDFHIFYRARLFLKGQDITAHAILVMTHTFSLPDKFTLGVDDARTEQFCDHVDDSRAAKANRFLTFLTDHMIRRLHCLFINSTGLDCSVCSPHAAADISAFKGWSCRAGTAHHKIRVSED